ncbi:hypothetical protein [Subtercola vilae]|uniref:DUF2218 domain-containing protein n=1 Tax=Subtercola vilae TaxID=2056433 RepID=A0A4T2BY66_9MICO|nr:hypothetical protein [Subtercola vilae]TIH36903.1 hypothetical protein D4765_09155 [Subtercola vilae]
MIAMTGTLRTADAVHAIPELGQTLRRNYEHILLHTGQMLVVFPTVGTVLVTEQTQKMRFDLVADSRIVITTRISALETDLAKRAPGQTLRLEWCHSGAVPVPFR